MQTMKKAVIKSTILLGAVGTLSLIGLFAGGPADAAPTFRIGVKLTTGAQQPPTTAQCLAEYGVPCYDPQQMRAAYGVDSLINAGYTGAGETIVLIESYGSPTLAADLEQFDADFGLPDPPSLKVLAPLGPIPPFDSTQPDQVGWAIETSLDVQWAHAMAPGASIVVLVSPVDETEGVQGLPEFLAMEQYALDHHLGKIISQSWAATENTLFADVAGPQGPRVFSDFNFFYALAALNHVTVLASTGDDGSQNAATYSEALGGPTSFYTFPTVNFPASSPLVTAVGGTTLFLDAQGRYQYETVWNDSVSPFGPAGAGGGGISQVFPMPEYQQQSLPHSVSQELHGHRGIPDLSYNADDVNSPVLVYVGIYGQYLPIGGTSCGSPQWAGIVADLNQYAGAPLGFLNPRLYAIGGEGRFPNFGHDVKIGNNAYGGVPGYSATVGWDPASGWGTPKLDQILRRWSEFAGAQ
jgi:subtilase family serine protease